MKVFAFLMLLSAAIVLPSNDLGVSSYPNATEMPEATARLMQTKGSTWIAARAYRTDDAIKDVVKYFRDQAAQAKKPTGENGIVNRLLADNWEIDDRTVSGAHEVFGVNKELRGVAKERTRVSFGTILLDDSLVRVHIMTPYPVPPAGIDMAKGTMIVMIRERIPDPKDSGATGAEEEVVYTGRDVTRKVRLKSKPHPNHLSGLYGSVVLKAVFGSSGKITKIVVVKGVPGLTEEAIKAARKITFDPAIKDGRYVAQWIQLEYHFN